MTIIDVFHQFQTQEQAVEYLEQIRWKGHPVCPYCTSKAVGRHSSGDRKGMRWQCRDCTRAFSATVGTIFHGTHIPLRSWFLCIALMLNAKKSASSYQIARDLGMRRPTVWSMMHRIRLAMANDQEQADLLHGIVEADETYIGARRKRGSKRGRPGDGRGHGGATGLENDSGGHIVGTWPPGSNLSTGLDGHRCLCWPPAEGFNSPSIDATVKNLSKSPKAYYSLRESTRARMSSSPVFIAIRERLP